MSKYRTIGILGGMGPEATAEFYKRIIKLYQKDECAVDDADFPNIIINSIPAEDMLNDLEDCRSLIVRQLCAASKVLEQAGAEFMAIPCNTATLFLKEIRSAVGIPVLDITELAAQAATDTNCKTVGLIASTSTIKSKIYENKLSKQGMRMVVPSAIDQQKVNQIIMRILAGLKTATDRQVIADIATGMKQQSAETVIVGCTELPLLLSELSGVAIIDTIDVLAKATLRNAEQSNEMKEK